jgi:hypothetical protein
VKKLLVYLDDDFHEDVKELAHRKRTSMAALVRYALDYTFEDELDAIAGERSLEEYLRDPSSAISLDDYLRERGIVLQERTDASSEEKPEKAAQRSRRAGAASHSRA